jgi:N-acetylglucosamine-6-phosphate deacetylase
VLQRRMASAMQPSRTSRSQEAPWEPLTMASPFSHRDPGIPGYTPANHVTASVIADRQVFTDGVVGRLADGTLSGSVLPLNRAMKNLLVAGATPEEAVQAATLNPARLLGLEGSMGQVRVGRAADVVLVDADWEVEACLVGGVVGYAREGVRATA